MAHRFLVVLSQVCTLFLILGTGFLFGKLKLITEKGQKELTTLLLNCVSPCLIINAFQIDWDAQFLRRLGTGFLLLAGTYLVAVGVAALLFRRQPEDLRPCLQYGSMYGNVGFMGLPLVSAVLGEDTAIYAILAIVVFNLFAFTHGVMLMGGRGAFSPGRILKTPALWAVAVGLVLLLTRLRLPGPIYTAMGFISDMNTPLAMIVIGAQLSRANLLELFKTPLLYAASAVKLLFLPALTAVLLLPLHLDPTLYTAVVILTGTPAAGFTSIFAQEYHRDVTRSAQLVSLSTLLSALTLPLAALFAEFLAR